MTDGLRSSLKRRFPRAWNVARTTKLGLQLIPRLYGHRSRRCNLCSYQGRFLAEVHFPDIFTYDALCPNCGSLPRNRLLALAITQLGLLRPTDRLVHFAPEDTVRTFVAGKVREYKTADLNPKGVDLQENIERLSFKDGSWDAIICSHVLEHVDHRAALRELYRVLAPGGRLLSLFPVVEGWNSDYENDQVTSASDRAIHFGKDNHLRRFGREVRDEFTRAGFDLECFTATGQEAVDLGLIPGETLFIGRKALGTAPKKAAAPPAAAP